MDGTLEIVSRPHWAPPRVHCPSCGGAKVTHHGLALATVAGAGADYDANTYSCACGTAFAVLHDFPANFK